MHNIKKIAESVLSGSQDTLEGKFGTPAQELYEKIGEYVWDAGVSIEELSAIAAEFYSQEGIGIEFEEQGGDSVWLVATGVATQVDPDFWEPIPKQERMYSSHLTIEDVSDDSFTISIDHKEFPPIAFGDTTA